MRPSLSQRAARIPAWRLGPLNPIDGCEMAAEAGAFEFIEAKIRADAQGTEFGHDFEWLCKWYLENAPIYRGQFRKVWRWNEWPGRWGRDCGIDLVAETHDGETYAVQCKAVSPDHSVTKAEVDSFLSESSRRQIDYRLLIATTDSIGANAMRVIENQATHASVVLRGELVSAEVDWPTAIGGSARKPPRWRPRPHQQKAIKDVRAGFEAYDRGRLIMACGTGKTLTGLWINEALGSRRTLLLVPSISLVQQNLKEWGRHAKEDFDYLVVCSDESVTNDRDDPAMRYIADLGVKPTTDAKKIAEFLTKRRKRPALVISTYQSCDRVAKGQAKAKKKFDLTICDEAHRLVGHIDSHFATVLDDRKIRSQRRLFMTATPRYFTQRAKDRGAEQDIELVSMDDELLFGPEFHVLSFHDAITAKPEPLLTDYQVVVIGVTSAEAKAWAADAKLVRTKDGLETDARTLAAQIGLAKAVKEYDLQRVITFHRTIRRASRFVDATLSDSLPSVVGKLRPSSRPSGRLWARHISGDTPASKRASLLKELASLPNGVRGLIANCACLGEGVDVPALDGVAFIDPKGSVVDIIQAVGRVIRKAADKKIGTIIIPVFVDESGDADHALDNSAFQPVWQVLKALRAHDRRLADELDQLRTALGSQALPGKRVTLPANIVLDVPRLLLKDFEQAFYVRAVMAASERPALTVEQILAWADEHKARTGEWPTRDAGVIQEADARELWLNVDAALKNGNRGLVGGGSLAKLMAKYRGVRNRNDLPPLSTTQVLTWADGHFARTGQWPTASAGAIPGSSETWASVARALRTGNRGSGSSSTLAQLLADHRGYRHQNLLAPLTIKKILAWLDSHWQAHGSWPNDKTGTIPGTCETWSGVSHALRDGGRGLKVRGTTIGMILERYRGVRNTQRLMPLTIKQILIWADRHRKKHGTWPSPQSGEIPGTGESWAGIQSALMRGRRNLPKGLSITRLLVKYRNHRSMTEPPTLTVPQILEWADSHRRRTGKWPRVTDGDVHGETEVWRNIDMILRVGGRGLPAGASLSRLLADHRRARNRTNLPPLSVEQILLWADEHKATTGEWPNVKSGQIRGTAEIWRNVASALARGSRSLPEGGSLAQLLAENRGVRNPKGLPPLTISTILRWALEFHGRHGVWPRRTDAQIPGTLDTWQSIDGALSKGGRGLRGGSSLRTLLKKYRNGKPVR